MFWFHKLVTVGFIATFSWLTQEVAVRANSLQLAPLVPPNSERFFKQGRQQFEEEIRRWPQRRELNESNLLQIEKKFRKEFSESLREQGVQSLEDLTIPSQLKEEFP